MFDMPQEKKRLRFVSIPLFRVSGEADSEYFPRGRRSNGDLERSWKMLRALENLGSVFAWPRTEADRIAGP